MDYTVPSVHWPIALLNTIAKVLSACVSEDLMQMAEMHDLLPANHFSCHPGRTTTDSLHYVTKFIKDAWHKKEVVSALFLDIKSAFPNVVLSQLIHDMRCRGVPAQYTDWIREKVEGRCTMDSHWSNSHYQGESTKDSPCPESSSSFTTQT